MSNTYVTDIITSLFDKDMAIIILGYYFLISDEFKLELSNVMNDRSNRKLQYINFPGSTIFTIKSGFYGETIIIDLFHDTRNSSVNESREIDVIYRIFDNGRLYNIFKNSLPLFLSKKSLNRLTREEFLSI